MILFINQEKKYQKNDHLLNVQEVALRKNENEVYFITLTNHSLEKIFLLLLIIIGASITRTASKRGRKKSKIIVDKTVENEDIPAPVVDSSPPPPVPPTSTEPMQTNNNEETEKTENVVQTKVCFEIFIIIFNQNFF